MLLKPVHEFTVTLPVELSKQQQGELLRHFVQEVFVDEGMVAYVAIHREVKERNEKKLALQDVEQRLEQFEKHELILKALSPAEKQELGQLSKVLKMYVQPETLADKRRMLYLWYVKLQVQLDLGDFNEAKL
ncbi:MAG TPA: MobA/MobL family protein [Erysipelothrix sp.]